MNQAHATSNLHFRVHLYDVTTLRLQLPYLRDPDAHQARDQGENAQRHEGLGQEADGEAQGKAGRKGKENLQIIFFKCCFGTLEFCAFSTVRPNS